jgi:hypothetical protein
MAFNLVELRREHQAALAQIEEVRRSLLMLTPARLEFLTREHQCGARYHEYYVDPKHQEEKSEHEHRTDVFRYLTLNLLVDGRVPTMPKIKGGKPSKDEQKIIAQAERFKQDYPELGIEFLDIGKEVEYTYGSEIIWKDRIDALVYWNGKPYVLNMQLCGDINNKFGPRPWGLHWTWPHTQILMQAQAMKELTGQNYGSLYALYDYRKPKPDYLFLEIPVENGLKTLEMHREIQVAFEAHSNHLHNKYPATGQYDMCESCRVEFCPGRVKVKPVKTAF